MAQKTSRILIGLICEDCGSLNYVVSKNKINKTDKLRFKKYCKNCNKHKFHKETKKLD